MNTLIGVAVHVLYLYSVVSMFMNLNSAIYSYGVMWESPIILIIITNIGNELEKKLTKSTTKTLRELRELKNSQANLLFNDQIKIVKSKDLKINDIVLVKKGDIVPSDAKIINGIGRFNYANITGESREMVFHKDEEVLSGSFNLGDAIQLQIIKTYHNSTLAYIVDKIEDATMMKPRIQKVTDKILKWFIPAVFTISFLTFCVWLILGLSLPNGINLPWLTKGHSPLENAIRAGVVVLAIACPCALGIATPLVITVTSSLSMKAGLLVNNVNTLEAMNKIKYFVFDKTGTITTDQLIVWKIRGNQKWIGVAKALEETVKHPIASAILSLKAKTLKVSNIKSIENKGISGIYQGQKVEIKTYDASIEKLHSNRTLVALYVNEKAETIFELENKIRDEAIKTIYQIKQKGFIPVMITGDGEDVAKHIAKQVGIEKVHFNIDPIGKGEIIQDLQKTGKVVFVGDGFNDSIAMKKAEISISFATGSDITNSLADISIINNNFNSIYKLILISKMNKNKIIISMLWAVLFNLMAIPIAIVLLVPPWGGAVLMSSSNIFVIANALIYKNQKIK